MAVSQADIDALNAALAKGERTVRHGDKMVEYRSVEELLAARDALQAQLTTDQNAANGTTRPRQTRLTQSGRGF